MSAVRRVGRDRRAREERLAYIRGALAALLVPPLVVLVLALIPFTAHGAVRP